MTALVPAARPASSRQVARRVPRPQSLPVQPSGDSALRPTEFGRISVSSSVVAKLASRAALEVPDAGAAAPRVLGHTLHGPGLDRLGVRETSLEGLPKTTADVDGRLAFVGLTISVRYPAPVRRVAAEVRDRVRARLAELTGLDAVEVDVRVPALVTDLPAPPRVT